MLNYLKYILSVALCYISLQAENYSYTDLLKKCETSQAIALEGVKSSFDFDEKTQFHLLEGGLTRAKVYSFEVNGEKFVLRFLDLAPSHSQEMRQGEIQAIGIGHQLGIAPPCIFSDQNAVLMVIPFIEGHALQKMENAQLVELGKMVRSLHSYSGAYPMRYSLQDRLRIHYQKGKKTGIAYPTGFDQEMEKVLNKKSPRPLVPSHGDLNRSNILVDNSDHSVHIIDWTTATWEDPFFDLSYFCLLAGLSPAQERLFLESYFGHPPSEKEIKILQEEQGQICLLTATLWLRYSEAAEDQTLPLEVRILALDRELHSPTLKLAEDYLRDGVVIDLHSAPKSLIKSYALGFYKAYLNSKTSE